LESLGVPLSALNANSLMCCGSRNAFGDGLKGKKQELVNKKAVSLLVVLERIKFCGCSTECLECKLQSLCGMVCKKES
jgi:hypothetical protein